MAAIRDEILRLQKKLEHSIADEKAMQVIKRLKTIPMTVDLLMETGIGKTIRNFRKKPGDLGKDCKTLILSWKDLVIASSESIDQLLNASTKKGARTVTIEREDSYTVYGEDNSKNVKCNQSSTSNKSHDKKIKVSESTSMKNSNSANGSERRKAKDGEKSEHHSAKRVKMDDERDVKVHSKSRTALQASQKDTAHSGGSNMHSKSRTDIQAPQRDTAHSGGSNMHSKSRTDIQASQKDTAHSGGSNKKDAPILTEELPKKKSKLNKKQKKLISSNEPDGFTSSMASFEDCLSLNDVKVKSKKKPSPSTLSPSSKTKYDTHSPSHLPTAVATSKGSAGNSTNYRRPAPDEEMQGKIMKALEFNIDSTLPTPVPDYKPMRHSILDSPPRKKKQGFADVDTSVFMSSKHNRTQVFSGRKTHFSSDLPSLYDMCIRVLQENIDAIEFTGGVPYDQLKPVLQRCTPQQLYQIEDYNPYLVEDTEELWKAHCQHEFKGQSTGECETWREFYLRKFDEREAKLKSITASISASMSKALPVRQTKLAYVDTVAKPPRNIARKQAKFGTAGRSHSSSNQPKINPASGGPLMNIRAAQQAAATAAHRSEQAELVTIQPVKAVKKVAPLMQKSLKLMKSSYRR